MRTLDVGSRLSCKRTSYSDHCVTSVTDCCETVCVLVFDVNMVAERRSMVLGSLSSESIERADQCNGKEIGGTMDVGGCGSK